MSSNSYEPLRITAHFRTGIVVDEWFPLDGILYYQVMRERFGQEISTVAGGNAQSQKPDPAMPFAVIGAGTPNWYYACSWAQPRPWWIGESVVYWHKRWDEGIRGLVDFGKRKGKINIAQGEFKAYRMPMFVKHALKVHWYCVGDGTRLEYLLSTIFGIGKKRNTGNGRVTSWKIEQWPEDWSVLRDGKLTRGVPFWDAPQPANMMNYAIRPPGYMRQNRMQLARPE